MTETKLKKKLVNIDFYSSDMESRASRGANGRRYTGRLIGLVNDKEFAAIIRNKELQKKCFTSATMPLTDIVDHHEKLEGYRMVIAMKKVDGEPIIGNKLFITERLSLISYLDNDKSAGITGENGAYMFVEEVKE
jgi:hypothetical protein